jgi:23S rRNA (adenine-N6)-dimethyltransferase
LRERFAHVVDGDATSVALPNDAFRVVANLPFLHTTAILRRLFDPKVPLVSADVIVQWELVAKRAAVWPSTQLGVEWSAWHDLSVVRRIPRCCFAPPPAVDAGVLRAARREQPLVPATEVRDYRRFLERGFRDGLRAVVTPYELKRASAENGFDPHARPRDLDPHQWAALYAVRRRR